MNNKKGIKKSITGITLAAIMIASIFAMVVPISGSDDDIGTLRALELYKETYPDASAVYKVGDEIMYKLVVTCPDGAEANFTVDVTDTYPNGTVELVENDLYLDIGQNKTYYRNYTVTPADGIAGAVTNKLSITGEDGNGQSISCSVDETSQILAQDKPVFEFEFEQICCRNMSFNGSASYDPDGTIENHTWDFGDGNTQYDTGAPGVVEHTYTTCGNKMVTLSGYDNNGLYNETTHSVYVDCGPTAVAIASPSCFEAGGTEITFDGTASTGDTIEIVSWNWAFSDGGNGTSDDQNVTTRMVDNVLTATLEVFDGHCYSTATVLVIPCSQCALRIYGIFGEGPGDDTVTDPELPGEIYPENKPYTDPEGPFYPQHEQAPRKDFITFNPAIMDHNQGYPELSFTLCGDGDVQVEKEKIFKRMWYEKEWFKDDNGDGKWDVVVDTPEGPIVMTLDEWNSIPEWEKEVEGLSIREWNNPSDPRCLENADTYGPAINQEFTYMFLDTMTMPIMIQSGSRVLIPMAHNPANPYRGLNSFDALLGDGINRDYVMVESEKTLGMDIDHDGNVEEPMDGDGIELSGDETVVLVLPEKRLVPGDELQFFDHKVELIEIYGPDERTATLLVSDNEGGGSTRSTEVTMAEGEVRYFYRAEETSPGQTFFLRVISINHPDARVKVEVGRMFGQTYANIGANQYWSQKAFIVDEVFYNVVAIKAEDDCIKYITIRQKLPKLPIKLYGKHLEVWGPRESPLPEMPPFNMPHEICVDVWSTWYPWYQPHTQQDKVGPKRDMPPLVIDYIYEGIEEEERYKGELKEIYHEDNYYDMVGSLEGHHEEYWTLEWFKTLPWQYTELRLPKGDKYLVTLSWIAPESEITIWDGEDEEEPIAVNRGERFKFWFEDCTGPIYIDNETSSIRLYGTFGEGPGDQSVACENKPYTDPMGPFDPQHEQAPVKDFMTFNPAIMEYNQGYPELSFTLCGDGDVQEEKEKVFKRMWYEKEWFKDDNGDGEWDVVVDTPEGPIVMTLNEWNSIPEWEKEMMGWSIREWNNPSDSDVDADTYGPAINQEFTYMFLDDKTMPIMIQSGSRVLIPMASREPGNGIDSFDALLGDGIDRDYVMVESEETLGLDIDHDGNDEKMDGDGRELSGDETVVLVLPSKTLHIGDELQFFDHKVKLMEIFGPDERTATLRVSTNEGGDERDVEVELGANGIEFFYRGETEVESGQTFYVRVISLSWLPDGTGKVRVEVGRMFGQTYANIGASQYWSQKAFMVDEVFYNVVAIKAHDNCIKYITIRQKLPKEEIKLYGKHLKTWDEGEILAEMPPFNMEHEILIDVQNTWTRPYSQRDKIGPKESRGPLEITYIEEDEEERFKGELREIYNENEEHEEHWNVEWFFTQPWQYTAFVMPEDQLYLVTLAWEAPQSEITIWNCDTEEPMDYYTGERVKFWYGPDSVDRTTYADLYVNRVGPAPAELTVKDYYGMAVHGGNGDDKIDLQELVNAIMDYLDNASPFGDDPFGKDNLIDYILDYIDQEGYE